MANVVVGERKWRRSQDFGEENNYRQGLFGDGGKSKEDFF